MLSDINAAWKKVTERVNKLRKINNSKLLSHRGILFFALSILVSKRRLNSGPRVKWSVDSPSQNSTREMFKKVHF